MSYLNADMSGKEIAGYVGYVFGGSIAVGAARLANRAVRAGFTLWDSHRLTEVQSLLTTSLNTQQKDDLKAEEAYLKGKLDKAKWETIKGGLELIPILGPLFLLIASMFTKDNNSRERHFDMTYNSNCYDPEKLISSFEVYGVDTNKGQTILTPAQRKILIKLRKENNHEYQMPGFEFADMRFLGVNNLYRPTKLFV